MIDFTNLAEASKIINELTDSARVMHREYTKEHSDEPIEQILNYIHELFIPLFDTDINITMTYGSLTFHKRIGCTRGLNGRNSYVKLYKKHSNGRLCRYI